MTLKIGMCLMSTIPLSTKKVIQPSGVSVAEGALAVKEGRFLFAETKGGFVRYPFLGS